VKKGKKKKKRPFPLLLSAGERRAHRPPNSILKIYGGKKPLCRSELGHPRRKATLLGPCLPAKGEKENPSPATEGKGKKKQGVWPVSWQHPKKKKEAVLPTTGEERGRCLLPGGPKKREGVMAFVGPREKKGGGLRQGLQGMRGGGPGPGKEGIPDLVVDPLKKTGGKNCRNRGHPERLGTQNLLSLQDQKGRGQGTIGQREKMTCHPLSSGFPEKEKGEGNTPRTRRVGRTKKKTKRPPYLPVFSRREEEKMGKVGGKGEGPTGPRSC